MSMLGPQAKKASLFPLAYKSICFAKDNTLF